MTAPSPPERPRPSRGAVLARTLLTGRTGALLALLALVLGVVVLRLAGGGPQASGPTDQSPAPSPSATAASPSATTTELPSASPSVSAILPTPPPLTQTTCIPQSRSARLRVVTFNIKSGRFGGYSRLPELIDEIKSVHPDIVLLQEVDVNRPISGRRDEPAILGTGLGYQYTFGLNVLRPGDSQYGTAILSRHQILASNTVHLPNRPGLQQRGLLGVSIRIKGIPINVYDTHLSNESATMRVAQIKTVSEILGKDPAPKILGGDLNAIPSSPVLALATQSLTDTWAQVGVGPGHTVPASAPRARIDYLLYQQGQDTGDTTGTTITPISAEVLGAGSSDHRAVFAKYRLDETASPVCVPTG